MLGATIHADGTVTPMNTIKKVTAIRNGMFFQNFTKEELAALNNSTSDTVTFSNPQQIVSKLRDVLAQHPDVTLCATLSAVKEKFL